MNKPSELKQHILDAINVIRKHTQASPSIGIILGTGLGRLARELSVDAIIDYSDIPHFPVSTVESHAGKLIFGTIGGKSVVVMQGRFHYYEGYTMKQITFPVRVMGAAYGLNIKTLLVSNAAGSLNPSIQKGDIMIMTDHINLLGDNPLIGPNEDELGPRFPDMSEPYNRALIALAERGGQELRIPLKHGVYAAFPGPNLETRAEYRFLQTAGADAIGMSTIPEDIVAVHMGMRVLGFSVITDECFPESLTVASVDDIIAAATKAEPTLTSIMNFVIEHLEV